MNEQQRQIGKTIWLQLNKMDRNLLMCMGTRKPNLINDGLRFTVSGLSFKGDVEITLNGNDLYDIKLVKNKRTIDKELKAMGIKKYNSKRVTVKEINNIFVDELPNTLEFNVENRAA